MCTDNNCTNIFPAAPEMVKGLRAEHTRKHDGLYDIAINWDKPVLQPDNYTLQIDLFRFEFEPRLSVVPGVSTFI